MWRRRVLTAGWWLAVVCFFLGPYAQLPWWPFPASTAVLLGLFLWRWRGTALARVGLRLDGRQVRVTLVLALLLWVLFEFLLVPALASSGGLFRKSAPFWHVAEFPFQALNEEMLLGALLLFALVDRWRNPIFWSIALAVVFAVLHYALYRYGTLGQRLGPSTLVGLTAVGCVRNATILLARHIGYAWALHAAWNIVVLSGTWLVWPQLRPLSEPEVFDAFLGHFWLIVPAAVAAFLLLLLLVERTGDRDEDGAADDAAAT